MSDNQLLTVSYSHTSNNLLYACIDHLLKAAAGKVQVKNALFAEWSSGTMMIWAPVFLGLPLVPFYYY